MTTINISLPEKLKAKADQLIEQGYYVSFSDLTRTALRRIVADMELDILASEAKEEVKKGKAKVLQNPKDVADFMNSLDEK